MKTEKIFAILFLVGIIFKMLHWEGAGLIVTVSLLTISVLYFPMAFYFFCDKTIKRQNLPLSIISGLFLSLIPVGILFKIQYWVGLEGGEIYLLIGFIAALTILSFIFFLKRNTSDDLAKYYKIMVLRTGLLAVLAIIFYLTPSTTLIKLQYWNDPELARLKTLHYLYPNSNEYERQHDEYILKRDSLEFIE